MAATTRLTLAQFSASPLQHDIIRSNILEALFAYTLADTRAGLKVLAGATFAVCARNVFAPDVSVVALGRLNPREQKCLEGTPDLAIEVISSGDFEIDLRSKVHAHLAHVSMSVRSVYPDARSVMFYWPDSIRDLKARQSPKIRSCPASPFLSRSSLS
jgi:hypothetical protein